MKKEGGGKSAAKSRSKSALEKALEKRLEALTLALGEVEVAGKGIDMLKEIKELHALLEGMDAERRGEKPQEAPRLVVVWGGAGEVAPRQGEFAAGAAAVADAKGVCR